MFEFYLREALCHFQCGIHKTKGCGKYQASTLARQSCNDPFGVRSFGNLFNEHSFNFIAQLFLESEAALIMLVGPAMIADRSHVDEADF